MILSYWLSSRIYIYVLFLYKCIRINKIFFSRILHVGVFRCFRQSFQLDDKFAMIRVREHVNRYSFNRHQRLTMVQFRTWSRQINEIFNCGFWIARYVDDFSEFLCFSQRQQSPLIWKTSNRLNGLTNEEILIFFVLFANVLTQTSPWWIHDRNDIGLGRAVNHRIQNIFGFTNEKFTIRYIVFDYIDFSVFDRVTHHFQTQYFTAMLWKKRSDENSIGLCVEDDFCEAII